MMKIQTATITLQGTGGEFNELDNLNYKLHLECGRPGGEGGGGGSVTFFALI
jgi:hypothetical protein